MCGQFYSTYRAEAQQNARIEKKHAQFLEISKNGHIFLYVWFHVEHA